MNHSSRLLPCLLLLGGALVATPLLAGPAPRAAATQTSRAVLREPDLDAHPHALRALRRLRSELGLTPQQIETARGILLAHQADVAAALDKVVLARAGLRDAIRADVRDDAALAADATVAADAQRELILATTLLRADLYPILTEEQAARLEGIEARVLDRLASLRETVSNWILSA